jgi:flavoprotein
MNIVVLMVKLLKMNWREFETPRTHVTKADTTIYRASKKDCDYCPLMPKCCPNTPIRKIAESIYESSRDVARAIAKTEAYQQSRKDRKKIEMLFAHLKRILKMDKLRLSLIFTNLHLLENFNKNSFFMN